MQSTIAPILTIVIPVLKIEPLTLDRTISSAVALCQEFPIEIVMVNSDPNIDRPRWLERYPNLHILNSPPKGVYPAFNEGVSNATGEFVHFLGDGDLILPGMADVLRKIMQAPKESDVVIARVLDQRKGIPKNYHSKYSLIFTNWPHQGMIFRRSLFEISQFRAEYLVQGDHHLNIVFTGVPKIKLTHFKEVVAYFSRGGISTTQVDKVWREEMPMAVSTHFGLFFGILCRFRRFAGTVRNHLRK